MPNNLEILELNKSDFKNQIEERINLGKTLAEKRKLTKEERQTRWEQFISWDKVNLAIRPLS